MHTEKSQTEGKRIMPETRFTEFPELSVDPRVEISRSASKTYVVVVVFRFNGPLRQYFSLYRAVSQREGERGEKG